jgi:hypothetical protein
MLSARLRDGVAKRQGGGETTGKAALRGRFPCGPSLELDAFDCGVGCAVAAVLG